MKKFIRDAFFVLLLFAAVLAAPIVLDNLADDEDAPPAKQAERSGGLRESDRVLTPEEMPMPSPAPADSRESAPGDYPLADDAECDDAPLYGRSGSGQPVIDGGGGVDTVIYGEAGPVILDGQRFRGMEKVVLRNGAPNMIRVKAGGLASLENNTLFIEGDPGMDTVVLDPCLSWQRPDRGSGGENFYATSDGSAFVVVNEGVAVVADD